MSNPTPTPTLTDAETAAAAGLLGGGMFMMLGIFVVILLVMYASWKGMCRFTEGDNFFIFWLKWFANAITSGILGMVMFFTKKRDCSAYSKINLTD